LKKKLRFLIPLLFALACLSLSAACAAQPATPPPDLVGNAGAEATAIIARAQATALILQAHATAAALVQNLPLASPTSRPTAVDGASATPASPAAPTPTAPSVSPTPVSTEQTEIPVQLLSVSIGAENNYIVVSFKASPATCRNWTQGNVWVIDEASKIKYNNVPVMPIIGPLFARPKVAGQSGYVMFINTDGKVAPGAVVTVVLGDFVQEHVKVTNQ
jgi:hypothetical protein